MRTPKHQSLLFSLLLIIPFGLQGQNLTFEDFDTDDDNLIEEEEFEDTFTDHYSSDWDNTDDTELDDEDFYTATFSVVDVDNDDLIAEDEWDWGYDYHYGDFVRDDFDLFDYDDDNFLSYEEYSEALYGSDYYLSWDIDRDSYLSQAELAEAVFENWDINKSGVLTKSEFYNFDANYLDI